MIDDWRIEYEAAGVYPGASLAFGSPRSGIVLTAMPAVSDVAITNEDAENPRSDGVRMGTDQRGGTTIGIEATVDGRTEDEGLDLLEDLQRAWRADAVRTQGGAVAALVSHRGRRAFGRPRRFTPDAKFSHLGRYDVTADFTTVDDLWYGDEQSIEVGIAASASGGFVAPFVAPFVTTSYTEGIRTVVVRGKQPTWARIEIVGPIVNPEVEIFGVLRERFLTTLGRDDRLVLDARPWSRSILLNGKNASGLRTRTSTPLDDALIPAGEHLLALRGQSETGTAIARVTWADAFTTY